MSTPTPWLADASASVPGKVSTGDQTWAGVKTFNSSPIVPSPAGATSAINRDYCDNAVSGVSGTYAPGVQNIAALRGNSLGL